MGIKELPGAGDPFTAAERAAAVQVVIAGAAASAASRRQDATLSPMRSRAARELGGHYRRWYGPASRPAPVLREPGVRSCAL